MKNKNLIIHTLQILLIIVFIISIVPKEFQNDTFFTIALGERTVKYGIEEVDELVWHENLNFIHLRWLFDVVIYMIYSVFNFLGIHIFVLIIGVLQGVLYYYIINKFTKNKFLAFIATIITMYFNSAQFTGRAQIISFTLFLIEFYCIEKLMETNKNRYFICLLIIPLLIVNFHASVFPTYFVFYLPYIAEFILSKIKLKSKEENKIIIENRNIKKLIILMISGIILGFCSPIGIDAYKYMFKVMSGISTVFIQELQPISFTRDIYFVILICITFALLAFTKTKVKITDCLFILGFALMAIPTYRCIFFFYIISSICIVRIINDFINEYEFNLNFISQKNKLILFFTFSICLIVFSVNCLLTNMRLDYINLADYPVDATNYILNNIDISNMRIFNGFNYGSYLELKGIKAFMDSRSEMYTAEFNPGTTILTDWHNMMEGTISYKEVFDRYKITHALVYNDEVINIYIVDNEDWKLIYRDDKFSLYEKIEKDNGI